MQNLPGTPNWIVPTPPAGDSSHRVADTEFVTLGIAALSAALGSSIVGGVASVTASTGLGQTNTTGNVTLVTNLTATANVLGADVNLNNLTTYFDGPSVAQGTSGTWFVSGTVTMTNTSGIGNFQCKLWDSATVISSAFQQSPTANTACHVTLTGFIVSPAANLRISCRDGSSLNSKIVFNNTGNSKDSTITAVRIA